MDITAALRGEHGAFYPQFDHLATLAEGGSAGDLRAAGGVLGASLAGHASLENELLLGALEERIGPDGPVGVMRRDHEDIEATLAALAEAQDDASARRLAADCVRLARDHFSREENALFPMAKAALAPEVLVELGNQWAARRGVALG